MSARGKLDYDKLLALVGQGLSPTAIANKLGCSRQWVHRWSRDRGLKIGGSKPGRPRTDQGRIVCLKLKVPLAVKRWANQNLDKVQSLVIRAYKNPTSGDIWEDVYDLQHSNLNGVNFEEQDGFVQARLPIEERRKEQQKRTREVESKMDVEVITEDEDLERVVRE